MVRAFDRLRRLREGFIIFESALLMSVVVMSRRRLLHSLDITDADFLRSKSGKLGLWLLMLLSIPTLLLSIGLELHGISLGFLVFTVESGFCEKFHDFRLLVLLRV